jgi:hypothetical protein
MKRYALTAAFTIFLSACNFSPPSQRAVNTVSGATVNSYELTSLIAGTKNLSLQWDSDGRPGRVVIADVLTYGSGKTSIAPPAGWSLIRDDNTRSVRQSLYWHALQAGEPNIQIWTFNEPVDSQGAALVLGGSAVANPVDASSGSSGAGFKLAAEPVTTASDGDLILVFYASDFKGTAPGHDTPANMGLILDQTDVHPYWVIGSYQGRKGKTEKAMCAAAQVFEWVAAQVAITRRVR